MGEEVRIYDNLVFSNKAFWKIDQFRICTGDKLVAGQEVEFNAEDCLDRTGKAFVTIERFEGRERNKVKEYIAPDEIDKPAPAKTRKSQKPVLADDELPLS
jgi:hypothetical protein